MMVMSTPGEQEAHRGCVPERWRAIGFSFRRIMHSRDDRFASAGLASRTSAPATLGWSGLLAAAEH